LDNNNAFKIHQWVGGTIGIYMLVMSLSGTAIVFGDDLTQLANEPEQIRQLNAYRATTMNTPPEAPEAKQLTIGGLIKKVEQQKPGGKVTAIDNINRGRLPLTVNLSGKDGGSIYIDNINGTVLGQNHEVPAVEWLMDLHHNLLLGKTGRFINGFGALILFAITITGIIVWWRGPNIGSAWRKSYVVALHKSGLPKVRSMHAVVGIWLAPMLLMVATTGLYFGFEDIFKPLLTVSSPTGTASNPTVDELVTLATASAQGHAVPGTTPRLTKLALPKKPGAPMRLWFADANDLPSEVWINKESGSIITSNGPFNCDNKSGLMVWFVRLHFAKFAGIWSKILWVTIGWLPALLYVSGIYMWRQKLNARKSKSNQPEM
jgi:uncharacterized iron-regulated membrane protein